MTLNHIASTAVRSASGLTLRSSTIEDGRITTSGVAMQATSTTISSHEPVLIASGHAQSPLSGAPAHEAQPEVAERMEQTGRHRTA
jgi:hypothetical protein